MSRLILALVAVIFIGIGIVSGLMFIRRPTDPVTTPDSPRDSTAIIDEFVNGSLVRGNVAGLAQTVAHPPQLDRYAIGYNRPRTVAFWKLDMYISSQADETIYRRTVDGEKPFVPARFGSDMILDDNGSLIMTLFDENRLVRVQPDGSVRPISKLLSHPSGLSFVPGSCYYVANYTAGSVSCVEEGGRTETFIDSLVGPVGLLQWNRYLYVTDYLSRDASVIRVPIVGNRTKEIVARGLMHATSVGIIDGQLYVIHTEEGVGVVSRILDDGSSERVLVTDLPDPVTARFGTDRFVYLVSPNDPDGRIMRFRFEL